jgi:hypothetical protein
MRLEIVNIKNPGTTTVNYHITVITRRTDDSTTIDGPTISSIFSIRN